MSRWCAGATRNAITSMIAVVATIVIWPAGALAVETSGSGGLSASPDSGPAVHYDTSSLPLRSLPPSGTPGETFPARPTPNLPSASSAVSSPDTSGTPFSSEAGGAQLVAPLIPSTSANFNGIVDKACGCVPPDPDGAAGPSQYVELANTELAVYSKTGSVLLGPEATNTLWSGFGGGCEKNNNGDGTVLFDTISQRWVVQQFSVSTTPYLDCVAVSETSDATGKWHRYSFQYEKFPDYPKMGVWPDAYYASFNMFSGSTSVPEVCAFNRAAMLKGEAASQQCFQAATSEDTLLPATLDGSTQPPSGEAEWFVALSPTETNALAYWKFHVDWSNPANSTLTGPTNLKVEAFSQACSGGVCIPQAETTQQLDSLADRLMYRLAYRNFGSHEAMVVTHAVTSGSSVGMRWYELRPSGGSLTVYQQGTYAPDSTYRWMGSIAMDKSGDMALGYSASSSSLHPQIRYTGRLVGDPLGTMPQGEATLYEGSGSQLPWPENPRAGTRWGDYTEMSIDPSDECTFWYVNEYLPSNGDFNWHTRIGSFKYPSCSGAPTAITEAATGVKKTESTLNGTVNPNGSETKYYFEYGLKKPTKEGEKYEHQTAEASAGSGTSNLKESKAITGLTANTMYHFRIVATNSNGTTDGSDLAFTTIINAPGNTERPVASPATPDQAVPESTTNGTWTNEPTGYAYQWERCNATGGECAAISGATSSKYTPVEADVGHTLVAKVTAKNSGGEASEVSLATNKVEPIGKITEYALPAGSAPFSITQGSDGALWFTDCCDAEKVGRITTSGVVTEYKTKAWMTVITSGPDGNLWATDATGSIWKITTKGALTEYPLTTSNTLGIAAGPDGNLWFTNTDKVIGKITTSGAVTDYTLTAEEEPRRITAGPKGENALWFTNGYCGFNSPGKCAIGKITTAGAVSEYTLTSFAPEGITVGPDGNLWFAGWSFAEAKIGKITPAGEITEYNVSSHASTPREITTGPDGDLWFTDSELSKIDRITTSGEVKAYSLPAGSKPNGITVGPDDNIWFTDEGTNKIGRITP